MSSSVVAGDLSSAMSSSLVVGSLQNALDILSSLSVGQLVLGSIGALVLTLFLTWVYRFPYGEWAFASKHNLRGPPSGHFVAGNQTFMVDRTHPRPLVQGWIDEYGHTGKMHGLLGEQKIYTSDPTAIKHIFMNADNYPKSASTSIMLRRMLGDGLITAEADHHRRQRRVLNPAFNDSAVKGLLPIFLEKGATVRDRILEILETEKGGVHGLGEGAVDIGILMEQTTLDTIGAAGFDCDFQTLSSKRSALLDAFHGAVKALQASALMSTLQNEFLIFNALPTPGKTLGDESRATMNRVGSSIVSEKTRAITQMGIEKDTDLGTADLLSRMIRANMANDLSPRERLTDEEVRAQICTFIFAGSETTGVALTWALYRLATNQEMQDRLREEVTGMSAHPDLAELDNCHFLDNFTREILRMDSPVPIVAREAATTTVMPLSRPIVGRDGKTMDSVTVQQGTEIFICVGNVNRDPLVWGPDAEEFNPDRYDRPSPFLESVPGVYGNLLTFIGGARNCIGWKFALAEFKAILATLVRSLEFAELPSKPAVAAETTLGIMRVRTPGVEGVVPLVVRVVGE